MSIQFFEKYTFNSVLIYLYIDLHRLITIPITSTPGGLGTTMGIAVRENIFGKPEFYELNRRYGSSVQV